jgi:hypothetical protein
MERVIAGICLTIAFVVMASVFTPGGSHAEDDQRHAADLIRNSADAHAGLPSLGVIEDDVYRVEIYATDHGPRYTIFDLEQGLEVGTLLTLDTASARFPDLRLPDMNRHDVSGPVMMADPPQGAWPD